ncbi:MAG: T9SS type A sorting domain-containing protein [Bacteroidales bacterium]|nr:T9SS type A sorting domain-containing protein [Bacteroidales bacterium]
MQKVILFFILIISYNSYSQTPIDTIWTKTMGGSGSEPPNYYPRLNPVIDITPGGDIYFITSTSSNDLWINNNIGGQDCWLVKLNADGDTLMTKIFGGSGFDVANSVVALDNGGCAVTGYTYSNDYDFTGNHDADGSYPDGFITCFDADGNITWSKLYGGSGNPLGGTDTFFKIIVNNSGNIVVVGQTNSINGDLTLEYDKFYVGWYLEVNPDNGNIITSKKVAGANHDENNANYLSDIIKLKDGTGYMTFGIQSYLFSDVFLLAKLGLNADTLWTREYGCNSYNKAAEIIETNTGDFLFTGTIDSQTGDVTNFIGGYDIWLVKTDSEGILKKQATFGGTDHEVVYALSPDNKGNYFLSGQTRSTDIAGENINYGITDFLLINFNSNLDTIYTHIPGGSDIDALTDVHASSDGDTVYVIGRTFSNDFFIHDNNGEIDVWLSQIKSKSLETEITDIITNNPFIYPNPTNGKFNVSNLPNKPHHIIIKDIIGRIVYSKNNYISGTEIDISRFNKGVYFVSFDKSNAKTLKVIVH